MQSTSFALPEIARRPPPTLGAAVAVVILIAGCVSTPLPPNPTPQPAPPVATRPAVPQPAPPVLRSHASNPKEYRRDGASHLYSHNAQRIFKGVLPPLLYAVGVLQVDLDSSGNIADIRWMRAPRHAPEVMAEIERTVKRAAPFPAPSRLGRVTYTDTWLWDKSGRFQLDTLTEGQR